MDRPAFHSQLKDVARRYSRAMERYDQAMARGDKERADTAIADMQDIERTVTIIVTPARK